MKTNNKEFFCMLEYMLIRSIHVVGWLVFNAVLILLALAACVLVGYQLFEGEYSLASLSVYEVVFMILVIFVSFRSWYLNHVAGKNLLSYLADLVFSLAYWMVLIFALGFFLGEKAQSYLDSANGGLLFLGSFLLAIYTSASFADLTTKNNDATEQSQNAESKI